MKYLNGGCFYGFIIGLIIVLTAAEGLSEFGPLQTVNRFPLHLLFLKPRPVSGELPSCGTLETTVAFEYSNTYFNYRNDHWAVLMDMEMMVSELSIAYGMNARMAIGLEVPLVSMRKGVLDGFLENYHDAIGVSNYHRENRPKNDFAYQLEKDDERVLQGKTGLFEPADVTSFIQYGFLESDACQPLSGSLLFRVKLPVGDRNKGLGSGRFDVGLYLPLKYAKEKWSLFFMPGAAFISDPDMGKMDIKGCNSYSLFGGLAYDFTFSTTLLTQLNYYSSPLEKTGLDELDTGVLELDVGFHHRLTNELIIEFAFSEDLTLAVPDFNLRLGFRWMKQMESLQ